MALPPPTEPAAARCDAAPVQAHVGHPGSAETIEAARVAAHAAVVRVLRPGDMATMDYREDRLDIMLDASETITGARCG